MLSHSSAFRIPPEFALQAALAECITVHAPSCAKALVGEKLELLAQGEGEGSAPSNSIWGDRAKKSKRRKSSSESSRGKKKDKESLRCLGGAARPEGAWCWSARFRADLEPLGVGDPGAHLEGHAHRHFSPPGSARVLRGLQGVLCFSALAAWLADSSARAELCSLALSSAVFQSAFNDLWAVREVRMPRKLPILKDPGSGLNSGVGLFSGGNSRPDAEHRPHGSSMFRRRQEELRGPPGEGEETESLLAKEPSEDRSYSSKAKTPSKVWPSARSPLALAMVLATLSFVVWTLPAPTLMGKLDLLRQSWRLNKVLDEAAELRSKLKAAELEKANLEQALVSERARSDSLHERLSASDGTAQSSKTELSNQQDMAGGLRSSNQKLQVDLEKERSARVQLLHELQQLKKAELAELKDPRLDSASILPVTAPSP
ncbi:unnamed protein product [Effrenium voratum]|uniref:Uncharacterized protein n=1 Tax=Effrenium voratum TaxID=2562239 RepID=A0AA36N045_9DINO|nr:unnamed protein product [Effrenium voratum]